jgi:hypothetical protein
METLINETRLQLKILSNKFFTNKKNLIKIIEFFTNKIWHIILSSYPKSIKTEFLNQIFYEKDEINLFQMTENKYFTSSNSANFLNVCIDQYLKNRKYLSKWFLMENFWKRLFQINLEKLFDSIVKELKKKTDKFSLIFFFLESIRFEKIAEILKEEYLNYPENHRFILFFLKFINTNKKKKMKKFFKKILRIVNFVKNLDRSKRNFSIFITKFYKNPFLVKKQKINCFLLKYSYFINNTYWFNFRKIIHNLSLVGIIGFDIFWIKKEKRIFQKLFINIISNKIKKEIRIVKKNLKIGINFYRLRKIKQWHFQFKTKNISSFEKFAIITGSGIINLNNDEKSFVHDLSFFSKISVWCKFVSGYSYGLINSNQNVFFEFFPKITSQNTISEYLKSGLIFGLSSNIKNYLELERSFFETCKVIINIREKEISVLEEQSIVRYGIFLALANVLSGGIRSPRKSELYHLLKFSISRDELSSEGASLALGILFRGSNSIYLLKGILKMVFEVFDENKTRLLITSISFIFYKNRNFCNHLFRCLVEEKSPQLRQSSFAIYSLGNFMSTDLNKVAILLSYLSKETDDNIKFTILQSIGFVFCSRFKLVEEILLQFVNHYNPFIRLGFGFAITLSSIGLKYIGKQIKILQTLTRDKVDFISQGACFCLGLLHLFSLSNRGVKKTVKILKSVINNSDQSRMTKFGSIIGLSLIEIKKTKSFSIKKKLFRNPEILFLFLQYWIWLPNIIFGFELLD